MIKINKRRFGIIGEKIAQGYLRNNGYDILYTNYYTRSGEIDIIAKEKENLIFIEVKTRTNLKYGHPSEAVNYLKKEHMRKVAKIFLTKNRFYMHTIRFDVVEILMIDGKCKVNHIKQIM